MNKLLLKLLFNSLFLCQQAFGQPIDVAGIYKSKKKFNDVWTLQLEVDSSYTFISQQGESIFPGKWIQENTSIILQYVYEGKTESVIFRFNPSRKWQLKGKPFPMVKFKLRKV